MKKLLIIGVLLIISCKDSNTPIDNGKMYYTVEALREKRENEYKIQLKEFYEKDSTGNKPLLIPYFYDDQYYSNHNFIIDSLNHIYYFYYPLAYLPNFCGTGLDQEPFPAPLIKIYPEDIINVTDGDFETFFKLRVLDSINTDELTIIYISSQKDSFKSPQVDKIFNQIETHKNNFRIIFRKITEEENNVLQYKKSNKPYHPELIKWDTRKTTFNKKKKPN